MTPSPTLHHTRRLIEHRYGRSLSRLRNDTTRAGTTDPVLVIVLRRYSELEATEHALAETRERLFRSTADDGSAAPFATAARQAQHLHTLAVRREEQTETLWDLLGLTGHRPDPGPPQPLRPVPTPELTELLPLARRVTSASGRLSRDALGAALRAHGVPVSNQRLSALLQHLRTERGEHAA